MSLVTPPCAALPTRMSPQAKSWLSETVRALRARLLKDLQDGLESTYRLSIPASRAELDLERASRRARLEAWLDEQARGSNKGQKESLEQARRRHLGTAVKLVAATWLNRLVVLAQMEALGLARTPVVTGGWNSKGFREFREFAPAHTAGEGEGYPFLLETVFAEWAVDLPGLFGPAGLTALVPFPVATLRHVVETLQAESLGTDERAGLFRDDTLLGWVYQFWNDPEREALDEKIRDGGKIENHELAAKTQLFTDRYMVEWLLQNSLGQIWLEMCLRQGWTAEVVATGTLDRLEERRTAWRAKRERGEVDLEALMPMESELEERWKYWVPRPSGTVPPGPSRLRDVKILDPACGSGHFLVIAFDLLVALYEEEARHRGEVFRPTEVARWVVEDNLHGIDIDPRAVQIAAAALWMKMKMFSSRSEVGRMNLVASNLGLASLPSDDPALAELVTRVEEETGISQALTLRIVETLKGADHLGSLLKVGEALDRVVEEAGPLFAGDDVRAALVERLEGFVAHHSRGEDLGLRLRGEQLISGVRFIRLVCEGQYHLVVGNPPYQNAGKTNDFSYINRSYPSGKPDLYSAFLLRGLELCLAEGISALLTLRGWSFLSMFEEFRVRLLGSENSLLLFGDFDRGAFREIPNEVVAVTLTLIRKQSRYKLKSVAVLPTPHEDRSYDNRRTNRKEASVLCGYERYEFQAGDLQVVPGQPLIYWWNEETLKYYRLLPLVGATSPVKEGLTTGDDPRFILAYWECSATELKPTRAEIPQSQLDMQRKRNSNFVPVVRGANATYWIQPLHFILRWGPGGVALRTFTGCVFRNPHFQLRPGVAFTTIGTSFGGRIHRYLSLFLTKGRSIFTDRPEQIVCLLNSHQARRLLSALNPGIDFTVGDVNRLPLFPIESADQIYDMLEQAFTQHEQARETSLEFKKPGPRPWKYAQEWAQKAVDRPAGAPLPEYVSQEEPEGPCDQLSYQLGLALGRFDENGIAQTPPQNALPHGILFLTPTGAGVADPKLQEWLDSPVGESQLSRAQHLRTKFFAEDHVKRYEKRPIYFPLSSEKKSFVAWTSIHRWTDQTLHTLLAEYLVPEQNRLAGEIADVAEALGGGDRKAQVAAHKRHEELLALTAELQAFIRQVHDIAEKGAPCPGCEPREVDAPFKMNLDDGVMINSAALWPLLLPQGWKDPKTWWTELCNAKGKKDYDWSHQAARYFPTRVDQKCQQDPSLAVAHGVFWKYHPAKAYQWELRLQSPDELGPDFRLDEAGSDDCRAEYEANHPDTVRELGQLEHKRRERKQGGTAEIEDQGLLDFEEDEAEE